MLPIPVTVEGITAHVHERGTVSLYDSEQWLGNAAVSGDTLLPVMERFRKPIADDVLRRLVASLSEAPQADWVVDGRPFASAVDALEYFDQCCAYAGKHGGEHEIFHSGKCVMRFSKRAENE